MSHFKITTLDKFFFKGFKRLKFNGIFFGLFE